MSNRKQEAVGHLNYIEVCVGWQNGAMDMGIDQTARSRAGEKQVEMNGGLGTLIQAQGCQISFVSGG